MNKLMERLEQLLGTKHLLVDDWNQLGWEFSTLGLGHTRICSLTNYTEAKAEGGTLTFTIDQPYGETGMIKIVANEGSGPHGVAWYDEIGIEDGQAISEESIEALAEAIKHNCAEEAQSSYWQPYRDGKAERNLLFRDKAYWQKKYDANYKQVNPEPEEQLVEVPHNWIESDWDAAKSRESD